MNRMSFAVLLFVACCLASVQSAAVGNTACPLDGVVGNWNKTIENCAKQVVGQSEEELCESVIEFVNAMFMINNNESESQESAASEEMQPSSTLIAKSFEAYFCVLQSIVQQSPQLAVMSFDCALQAPKNETTDCERERDITNCFEQQLKMSCSSMMNSRKRRSLISAVRNS